MVEQTRARGRQEPLVLAVANRRRGDDVVRHAHVPQEKYADRRDSNYEVARQAEER